VAWFVKYSIVLVSRRKNMGWFAEDVMTSDVLCVLEELDVRDLAMLLLEKNVTGAPVTTKEGKLVGVVSQTDLLRYHVGRESELVVESDFYSAARMEGSHLPQGFQIIDVGSATVADIMTPVIYSVFERSPIEDVARIMREKRVHRVIVEREGRIVGLISALDLIAALFSTPDRLTTGPVSR
jgi:CBS domain-containing protein